MPTTVSGNIKNLATAAVGSSQNALLRFTLKVSPGVSPPSQPTITGTGAIAPTSANGNFYVELPADSNGAVSGTIYSTRDATGVLAGDITVSGSGTAVYYDMQVVANGMSGPSVSIHAKNGATLDPSSVTPITTPPVVSAPTGDGTYLRIDAGNGPVTGLTTFTAGIVSKKLNNIRFADQFSGSDIGAQINAAIADLPTISGYAAGTVMLHGFSGTVTQSTTVSINSPFVNIIGPGSGALQITSSINGDAWRIKSNPFTVSRGSRISGFSLIGSSSANAVGMHIGDIVGMTFDDINISNFTGTSSSGFWLDNVVDWTERCRFQVDVANCTKHVRFTVNGGSSSFGYNSYDFRLNVFAGQTGISIENNSSIYHGMLRVLANGASNGSKTFITLLNTCTVVDNLCLITTEDTAGGGGTFINVASGAQFANVGIVSNYSTSPAMTNSISGLFSVQVTNQNVTNLQNVSVFPGGAAPQLGVIDNGPSAASAGTGTWMMANPGAAGNFFHGFGNNVYFDGTNFRTATDGTNNGGFALLSTIGSNDCELYVIPSTGGTSQTIIPGNLSNFKVATVDSTGKLTINKQVVGAGTTLARYARYTPTLSPSSVAANTTAEQTFTNVLTSGDIVVGVSKPTAQAGLGIVGWRASGTSLLITFSNNTGGSITPTASETYQVIAVQ